MQFQLTLTQLVVVVVAHFTVIDFLIENGEKLLNSFHSGWQKLLQVMKGSKRYPTQIF